MELKLDKNIDISKLTVDDINNMLIDKIKDYIDLNKNKQIEVKPDPFEFNTNATKKASNIDDELQELNLTHETKIDRQLYNIAENIVFSYFSLDNDKFLAVLSRVNAWGLDITLKEFIMSYYLYNKTNNYLRQFILLHFDKLIKISAVMIEKQLLDKMNLYNFNSIDTEVNNLKASLKQKEDTLATVNPANILVNRENEIVAADDIAQMKLDILNDLKKQNPELQD